MKIGIIGLGLIGGSIFKSLRALNYNVIAVSKSQNGEGIFDTYDVLKDCEIVFVCSAMNKTLEILDELEHFLTPDTIVTDVCSLKSFVCKRARSYNFIPSHPMAGTEFQGFENSFEGLFKGAKWVLTPFFGEKDIDKLKIIIKDLGAEPIVTTPDKHDEAAAMISHMPMLLAQALYLASCGNELAMKMASSGFRDMTRLALSNTEMANDMVSMNADNIQNSILQLYKAMGELTGKDYPVLIEKIKAGRAKMF